MNENLEHDELWSLLGRAEPVAVSPYFSRRVLREIRLRPAPPVLPFFLLRWLGAGAFAVLAAGFFLSLNQDFSSPGVALNSPELIEAFDVAAGLDTLLAFEDGSFPAFDGDL